MFHQGKHFVLINTGRQAGKSHYGARWSIAQVAANKGKNKLGAVIAPTYTDARVAIRKLKEVLTLNPALYKRVKYVSQPIPTFTFPDGYVVEVRSAHNPDSLRGPTYDWIWFDEVAKGSREAFQVVMPTLLATNGYFLGTTTPRGKHNWIYDALYLRAVPPGHPDHDPELYRSTYGVVTGSTMENVANLSEEAVEELRLQYGKGSAFEQQEVEGRFVSYEGLVYEWDEDLNYLRLDQLPKPEECQLVIGGIDFGWTDPSVAIVLGYYNGMWIAYDGVYESHLETPDFATHVALLTQQYKVSRWYADSARPDSISELKTRGLPVLPVVKPKIETRIKNMAMFANNNRFKVSYLVPDLRNEFQMYQYPSEEKLLRDKNRNPVDAHNHAMDAVGYALWSVKYLWRSEALPEDREDGEEALSPLEREIMKPKSAGPKTSPAGLYGV